ncbi:MAG: hypothetical protein ACWA44_05270 [Thiotrichales bacterium]
MNNTVKTATIVLIASVIFISTNASALSQFEIQQIKNGHFVTQDEINSKGLEIKIRKYGTVKITRIKSKNPKEECLLDVKRLQKYLESMGPKVYDFADGDLKPIAKQGETDSGQTICGGGGEGCLIIADDFKLNPIDRIQER